ncbi:MAG: hypothetical protein AB7S26_40375 [Sandaracinaceae bacterium]
MNTLAQPLRGREIAPPFALLPTASARASRSLGGTAGTPTIAHDAAADDRERSSSALAALGQVAPLALFYAARFHAESSDGGATLEELAVHADNPRLALAVDALERLSAPAMAEVLCAAFLALERELLGEAPRRQVSALIEACSMREERATRHLSAAGVDGGHALSMVFFDVAQLRAGEATWSTAYEVLHVLAAWLATPRAFDDFADRVIELAADHRAGLRG